MVHDRRAQQCMSLLSRLFVYWSIPVIYLTSDEKMSLTECYQTYLIKQGSRISSHSFPRDCTLHTNMESIHAILESHAIGSIFSPKHTICYKQSENITISNKHLIALVITVVRPLVQVLASLSVLTDQSVDHITSSCRCPP